MGIPYLSHIEVTCVESTPIRSMQRPARTLACISCVATIQIMMIPRATLHHFSVFPVTDVETQSM